VSLFCPFSEGVLALSRPLSCRGRARGVPTDDIAFLLYLRMIPTAAGFELTRLRAHAELTQTAVARRMGTTQSAVSRVETGRVVPSLDFIERYAQAIGMPITLVFGASPDEGSRPERARRVRRVLGDYRFDPWERDPTPAEQRSLESDGLTRERFKREAATS
jgi:transcriptional regulator with XRE-family HTH domain